MKLPPFWTVCPEAWFCTVESQFVNRNVRTDSSKFNLVIASLPAEVSVSILDVLRNPPQTNKYEHLKKELIARHSLSEEKRIEELLVNNEQGDRKPSQFFRDMEVLAASATCVNTDLLRKLWLRKLPPSIRVALTASGKTTINDVLEIADKIWEVSNPQMYPTAVNSLSSASSGVLPPDVMSSLATLTSSMTLLRDEVLELRRRSAERPIPQEHNAFICSRCRGRSSSRRSGRSSRSQSRNGDGSLCWYHYRFGSRARKCIMPCTYSTNANDAEKLNERSLH